MDQGANPATVLHVLIPVPIRLNLIALFHEFDNRIVLCNVALLYQRHYGHTLDVQLYGCLNMNQLFYSLKHIFFFHQIAETTYVNCYIPIGSIKLIKAHGKTKVELDFLENISFIFEPHDFNCIRAILLKTLESNTPIKISQFEQDFITHAGYAFNYLKYGFKSASDFFITFSDLFEFTDSTSEHVEVNTDSYSVKNSLGDTLIILKLPHSF